MARRSEVTPVTTPHKTFKTPTDRSEIPALGIMLTFCNVFCGIDTRDLMETPSMGATAYIGTDGMNLTQKIAVL